MSRGCLPSQPSASTPWLAAGAMLFGLLGSHFYFQSLLQEDGSPLNVRNLAVSTD